MKRAVDLSPYQILIRWLFDFEAPSFSKEDIHHFLFVNWHGKIGDAFVSSFLFRELKKINYLNTVSVITTHKMKTIYESFGADNIYCINQCNTFKFYSTILKIRKIDAIIPLLGILDFKHFFLFHVLKPKIIFGIDQSLRLISPYFIQKNKNCLAHDVYKNILYFFNYKNNDDSYILPKFENEKKYDILLNPFGSRPDKSLSYEKLDSLISSIYKNFSNLKIAILAHLESEELVKIQNKYKSKALELIRVKSIFDSMDILSRTRFIISVDTSITHITAGMKIDSIAIYSAHCNDVNIWYPRRDAPVEIIYSHPPFHKKNMNFFSEEHIIIKLRSFFERGVENDK